MTNARLFSSSSSIWTLFLWFSKSIWHLSKMHKYDQLLIQHQLWNLKIVVIWLQGEKLLEKVFDENSGEVSVKTYEGATLAREIYTSRKALGLTETHKRLGPRAIHGLCGILVPWDESKDTDGSAHVISKATKTGSSIECTFKQVTQMQWRGYDRY